jgi:mono/diheme cytochrome c family protein
MAYAGGRAIDTPFGAVFSSNITPDPAQGIGKWTADDFWRALHLGVSKDGHALYPAFPYTSYTHLTREDANALFAFLKTVPPAAQRNTSHALRWPYSTPLALQGWRALFFKPDDTAAPTAPAHVLPAQRADWQRGRYLVQGPGHCLECHGARNALGALSGTPEAPGSSGSVLPDGQWFAPSFSEPGGASVADWTLAEITTFLQTGSGRQAQASGPMAEVVLHGTQYLNDADARAMAVYLKALPQRLAVANATGGRANSTVLAQGAKLYTTQCADCHGEQGQGRAGAYPALAGNRTVLQVPPNNLINSVLGGGFAPATKGQPHPFGMPPFALRLSDAELAAVLSHIRSSWGNQAPALSEFDINKFRRTRAP